MANDEKVLELTEQIFNHIGLLKTQIEVIERKLNELQVLTGEV